MRPRVLSAAERRCAYCNEPFRFDGQAIDALQVGSQFVCNEFCAQALREEAQFQERPVVRTSER